MKEYLIPVVLFTSLCAIDSNQPDLERVPKIEVINTSDSCLSGTYSTIDSNGVRLYYEYDVFDCNVV